MSQRQYFNVGGKPVVIFDNIRNLQLYHADLTIITHCCIVLCYNFEQITQYHEKNSHQKRNLGTLKAHLAQSSRRWNNRK